MTRAVVADELGPAENYRLRPHDPGPPGPLEVRIAVKAAGVSFVDVLVSQGRYQARPPVPFVPGSECAGLVEDVGHEVKGFSIGQRVIATGWCGMFADAVNAPASSVWPAPEGLSFEEASVLAVSYTTASHALTDRGQLKPGETLLVLGAGGATGLAAVQLGSHLGARVIASASSEAKRAAALAAGAVLAIDSGSASWADDVRAANGGKPLDVVFDPVGGEATERAFRRLGWKGRHLVVGFPAGIAALPTNLPLLKGASLVGVNLSAFAEAEPQMARANHERVLALAAEGVCRPLVSKTFRLDEFALAMASVAQGEDAGRTVLIT
jgi:NADPH2:quinone reductase